MRSQRNGDGERRAAETATLVVQPGDEGRLDQFLARRVVGTSRRRARLAVAAGAVRVNGRSARKGQVVRVHDVVAVDLPAFESEAAPQPELEVPILYADDALIAVDKPAGMPSIAVRATDRDTVANYLLGRYPDLRAVGESRLEAGLVHRLDTATSGVLVAARTAEAWRALRAAFTARRVGKLYLAVVTGDVLRSGAIVLPIGQTAARSPKVRVPHTPAHGVTRARPALTRYRPLRRLGTATLVAVSIATGVRHQIRAHLAAIGHPVLGDAVYADAQTAQRTHRLLLHAARLSLPHPTTGRRLRLRCRLPEDFQAVVDDLAQARR
jgi:23S rRNA pseudouridine1911/1915/1917 synthase